MTDNIMAIGYALNLFTNNQLKYLLELLKQIQSTLKNLTSKKYFKVFIWFLILRLILKKWAYN